MERYKYKALNAKGRPIRGVVSAVNEVDLYNQLKSAGLELVQCAPIKHGSISSFQIMTSKVKLRDLIQQFMQMEQMQSAGVPLLETLADVRDTTENPALKDMMTDVYRNVSEGAALSEALSNHPKVFTNLYISLVKAGEDTGDMPGSYRQLIRFIKWVDDMDSKVRKAKRYPMILLFVVCITILVMMGYVVPQIVDFIRNMGQELGWVTLSLIATSDFVANYWMHLIGVMAAIYFIFKALRRGSEEFRYQTDAIFLRMPIAGGLIRKISIARYCQTFGALFSSGIDVLGCLRAARNTVSNLALLEALQTVQSQIEAGATLSKAFQASGEFPSLVVRMLKVGEELGNLTPVLDQVAEFYTKDVDETVQGLIAMIEPMLTAVLGIIILWIAAGVFGPIYAFLGSVNI